MSINSEIYNELNKQDWGLIIKSLTVYAVYQFKFWGLVTERGIKGYTPEEIVYEAIEKVYLGEWNWNPGKSDLLTYLKYHVVRGLIANLAKSDEVKKSEKSDFDNNLKVKNQTSDNSKTDEFNAQQIINFIKNKIGDDTNVEKVFMGYCAGLKRNDICTMYNLSKGEFNNAYRRFQRIIKELDKKVILNSII